MEYNIVFHIFHLVSFTQYYWKEQKILNIILKAFSASLILFVYVWLKDREMEIQNITQP